MAFNNKSAATVTCAPPKPRRATQTSLHKPKHPSEENLVRLPGSFNYIGAFLTFRCPYNCSFCINNFRNSRTTDYKDISGRKWLDFFERLEAHDVPITLQGGEPGIHKDFLYIVTETIKHHQVDILTNLAFDLEEFTRCVDPQLMNRKAPYAPIRVSYHPSQFTLSEISEKILFLMNAGFRVGLYAVTHPEQTQEIEQAAEVCRDLGIDFRTKPFLGYHRGRLYGNYAYPQASSLERPRNCECAASELLIAPDGGIYPCHHHLYNNVDASSHITLPRVTLSDDFKPCAFYGHCNPCDVKVKNNRFQQFGHVSARIRNIQNVR